MRRAMTAEKIKKTIRLILNILFAIVVIAGIYIGWGREVDDPDAWFPEWKDEVAAEQKEAVQPTEPAQPQESQKR